jgi:tripartite motif-containing protein 71
MKRLRHIFKVIIISEFLLFFTIQCVGTTDSGSGGNPGTKKNNTNNVSSLISTFGRGSLNTPGEMNFPSGVTVDNDGNVYVCSVSDSAISKFDKDGNFITRWSMSSCFGLEADEDNNIYVAVRRQHKVMKFDSNGTLLLEWGSRGNGDGQFNFPNDVAINNKLHRIYIADSENRRIQVFDTDGNFLDKWGSTGSGNGQFSGRGPLGVAIDRNTDDVYATDSDGRRIQKFDSDGIFLFTWGSSGKDEGEFRWPRDVEVDQNGLVYIASTDTERIQVFDIDISANVANIVRIIKGIPGVGSLTAQTNDPNLVDPSCITHGMHDDCTAFHNRYDGPFHPRGVAVDSQNGFIYVVATYAQRVDKFDLSGNYVSSFGFWEKGNGVFNGSTGMSIDLQRGCIYVADTNNFLIQKFDLNGNFLTSWGYSGRISSIFNGGDGSFDFPVSVAPDYEGNVYVLRKDAYYTADVPINRIQKFDENGNFLAGWNYHDPNNQIHIHDLTGVIYNPFNPINNQFDPLNGCLYVSNAKFNTIQCFDTDGNFIFEFGGPGSADGEFNFPANIAVDPNNGDIYIIDLGNSRIQRFSTEGVFIAKWGRFGVNDDEFMMDAFSGIYVDHNRYVYVADSVNRWIKVFDSNGNFIYKWIVPGRPAGLVVDLYGNVYVEDRWNNIIYKYSAFPR